MSSPQPSTILIAPPELFSVLKERIGSTEGEVLTFPSADPLQALDAITRRRPQVVVLERLFAATSRGTALIDRIKADPSLVGSEIRVVSHDITYSRVLRPAAATPSPRVVLAAPQPLDQRGTRRAPRFKIREGVELSIDGNPVALVDLSTVGAQVVSSLILRPNQRVRVSLPQDDAVARFSALIAWAKFEMSPSKAVCYRAGTDFQDADPAAVARFCEKNKQE